MPITFFKATTGTSHETSSETLIWYVGKVSGVPILSVRFLAEALSHLGNCVDHYLETLRQPLAYV